LSIDGGGSNGDDGNDLFNSSFEQRSNKDEARTNNNNYDIICLDGVSEDDFPCSVNEQMTVNKAKAPANHSIICTSKMTKAPMRTILAKSTTRSNICTYQFQTTLTAFKRRDDKDGFSFAHRSTLCPSVAVDSHVEEEGLGLEGVEVVAMNRVLTRDPRHVADLVRGADKEAQLTVKRGGNEIKREKRDLKRAKGGNLERNKPCAVLINLLDYDDEDPAENDCAGDTAAIKTATEGGDLERNKPSAVPLINLLDDDDEDPAENDCAGYTAAIKTATTVNTATKTANSEISRSNGREYLIWKRLQHILTHEECKDEPAGPSQEENRLLSHVTEFGITPYKFEVPLGNGVSDCVGHDRNNRLCVVEAKCISMKKGSHRRRAKVVE